MSNIIIRLDNDSIYINDSIQLGYDQSNLLKEYFRFSSGRPFYLEATQTSYGRETGTLHVRVLHCFPGQPPQHSLNPEQTINRVHFDKIDWAEISEYVWSYQINKLSSNFYNLPTDGISKRAPSLKNIQSWQNAPQSQTVQRFETEVKVKFDDAVFQDGRIMFKAVLKKYSVDMEFMITHEPLRKEFENIKHWFVKKIGVSFLVKVSGEEVKGKIISATATSDDISKIDEALVQKIREKRVLQLVNVAGENLGDKSIYTAEELFILLEDSGDNSFDYSTTEVLQILMRNGLAKNVRQFEYLAERQSLVDKISFTLRPHFGFLFKIVTPLKQYFVWELLDSHATYVWINSFDDAMAFDTIENQIALIRLHGRSWYRRNWSAEGSRFLFQIIEHDSVDLSEQQRFDQWKRKTEIVLI